MQITNLKPTDVGAIASILTELKENNPKITWDIQPMKDPEPSTDIKKLEDQIILLNQKINLLNQKIENIFGRYVLLQGNFTLL